MKLLLYCTKAKPTLYNVLGKFITTKYLGKDFKQDGLTHPELNGKIVAKCDFEVEEIRYVEYADEWGYETNSLNEDDLIDKSCLNSKQLFDYLKHCKNGAYAIHIKNLHIFDKPNELFFYDGKSKEEDFYHLYKTPQNMMYVYDIDELKYILISIKPEDLCEILNGEQTIIVRKKILKEMLK